MEYGSRSLIGMAASSCGDGFWIFEYLMVLQAFVPTFQLQVSA
ncbi:hypothetical protein sync_2359 [Synechococcus sp. CC9311]|nr:hypothetical protein sync_2359 [Synechococcus sp. CC9311]